MGIVSPGFSGRRRDANQKLPPGQYLVTDFPVLSAGPTPRVDTGRWEFSITTETGKVHRWDWAAFQALPIEEPTVDIHCVTKWSKLDTRWRGVTFDDLLGAAGLGAPPTPFVMAHCDGGYTSNAPVADLARGRAMIATHYEDLPIAPAHGGPARLLVPHLYFWKSAKWVRWLDFIDQDQAGFWEGLGYHIYGDPWREQRYRGDP